ncbi:MAG: hypothetical protein RSE13_21405 [Planktothrix sp. GU0601_MAG3]|nr:MAG: hypothetical protein RSE13_21405 [Planktothrix sp. GU0601_MAG3]
MFESLSGKKVIIIGMNSGVDLAIAKKILELGAKVVLSHPSSEKLNQAIRLISGEAIAALPVAHLGQPEALGQAVLSLMTNPYMTGVILPVEGGVTLI